jgi:VWFA-related protein
LRLISAPVRDFCSSGAKFQPESLDHENLFFAPAIKIQYGLSHKRPFSRQKSFRREVILMRYRRTPGLVLLILYSGCLSLFLNIDVFPQANSDEKTKLKNFGKSLKKFGKKDNSKDNQNNSVADEETIRVKTNLVVNDVLVINQKGNFVLGLDQNDFLITEDGTPQRVSVFSFGENAELPRSIVLIIDYSGSQAPYIKNTIEGAKSLVDKLAPQDKMAIVTDDVKVLVGFTKDKDLLKRELDNLGKKAFSRHDGRSEQYTALIAALNEMFSEEDIRPIVILQSDGDELLALKTDNILPDSFYKSLGISRKDYSFEDVYALVGRSRATIYSIIPGFRFIGLSREEQLAKTEFMLNEFIKTRNEIFEKPYEPETHPRYFLIAWSNWYLKQQLALSEIAELSGGYTDYIENPEGAENVYSNIFKMIDNRYAIGYYSTNEERNGKRRNVKIEVKGHPEYTVIGRKSFFAPEQ